MSELSRTQRANLTAIGALVAALLEEDDAARIPVAPPVARASASPADCEHPEDQLVSAATSGHMNAKVCRACGTTVEDR